MALGSIAGAKLTGPDGETIGTLVDGMMRCGDAALAYVVMTDGGVAGVGEQLYVLAADEITFAEERISSRLPIEAIRRRGPVQPGQWPSRV